LARRLLADAAVAIGTPAADASWRWPELRLRYGNAMLAEVLIAAGEKLGDRAALTDGLVMLEWLLNVQTTAGHLSVVPVGGWQLGEPRPGFDQQPIEVATLADACVRAFEATGDARWIVAVDRAADWFLGDNDVHAPLYDAVSKGGRDGLERDGCNQNQGAESTLAMISTFQQAHRLARLAVV
jgi:hypothetical protein